MLFVELCKKEVLLSKELFLFLTYITINVERSNISETSYIYRWGASCGEYTC